MARTSEPKPGLPAGGVAEKVAGIGFTGPLAVVDIDVVAAARGDRVAFAALYDRFSPRLYDFCVGMLRDREAAADVVQDTFCTAAARLHQLREPEKLRPWLYAIARHEALRRIRARRRERATDELPDRASPEHGPDVVAARSELAALVAEAAGGLSERERTILDLHYRHGLDGPELADALGVSHTNANTLVGRLRTTVERSLGALLVARRARREPGRCPALDAILDGWDGRLTVLMRKRIARHLDGCASCEASRRDLVTPQALLASAPMLVPAPFWLRGHVLTRATPHLHVGGASVAGTSWWPGGVKAGGFGVSAMHVAVAAPVVAVAVAVPLVALATTAGEPLTVAATVEPSSVAPAPSSTPRFAFDTPSVVPTTSATVRSRPSTVSEPPAPPASPGRPGAGRPAPLPAPLPPRGGDPLHPKPTPVTPTPIDPRRKHDRTGDETTTPSPTPTPR